MADYLYHLVHYMFVAACRFDNVDHFINFIGIEASTDPSATPTLDAVAKSIDVAPLFTSNCHRSQLVGLWRAKCDVWRSFLVLWATNAAEIINYCTTFGRSSSV
jgi:hypothetical protein